MIEGVESDDEWNGGDDLNQYGSVDVEETARQDQVEDPDGQKDIAVGPKPHLVGAVQIIEQ